MPLFQRNMKIKKPLARLTISLTDTLLNRLADLRSRHAVSISAVCEIAIRSYLDAHSDGDLGEQLRAAGAVRRRAPLRGR
jgi:metal-responsive CopG/Arc/MetJ family transcriptional regulator